MSILNQVTTIVNMTAKIVFVNVEEQGPGTVSEEHHGTAQIFFTTIFFSLTINCFLNTFRNYINWFNTYQLRMILL